jgi:branched-chain amino acid transport system substrate-binding protein
MGAQLPSDFGSLLRRYRAAAGFSQEELAERAHLSREAISTLERGTRRAPRKETIDLLAEALSLTEPERAALEAAARRPKMAHPRSASPSTPTGAQRASVETQTLPQDGAARPSGLLSPNLRTQPAPHSLARARSKLIASLVILLVLGAGVLTGSRSLSSGGGALCLATDLPVSGHLTEGKSIENAVNLAIAQHQNLGNGYTVRGINYDDTSPRTGKDDPSIGAHNVQQMAQNSCVVGLVGSAQNSTAAAQLPIAARAGLVMISPTNTLAGLTLRSYAQPEGLYFDQLHPAGTSLTYFRIAPNDVAQGIADGDFAFNYLKARTAYVVIDRYLYNEEKANGFIQGFQGNGGRILDYEAIPDSPVSAIAAVAAAIVAANSNAVFYGGVTASRATLLKGQLNKLGYAGFFIGDESIAGVASFPSELGTGDAEDTYASLPTFDLSASRSDAAARFAQDYVARFPGQVLGEHAAEAYDATMVLITALKHIISTGRTVTREAVREQVQHIQYTGVIGPISFDTNGDIVHGVVSLYWVKNGVWTFFQQLNT